jgi:hypothetical protein
VRRPAPQDRVPHPHGLQVRPGDDDPVGGTGIDEVDAKFGDVAGQRGVAGDRSAGPGGLPARILDLDQRATHLDQGAEDQGGIGAEADGLIERRSGEVEVESARGIADVAGQMPAPLSSQ